MKRIRVLAVGLLLAVAGCAGHEPDRLTMTPVGFDSLPGWKADHQAAMLPAFIANCTKLAHMAPDQKLGGEGEAALLGGTPGQWVASCAAARRIRATSSDAKVRAYFEQVFQPYRVTDNFRPDPLFTGYYEPELAGDLAPSEDYATPLFRTPPDLLQTILPASLPRVNGPGATARRVFGRMVGHRLAPYFDRSTIEEGVLDGQGLELAWLADPVSLFYMQIQGSGRVKLPDGRMLRVSYAAQNGYPFIDIGRLLLKSGKLTAHQLSMQDVRQWLYDHPDEARWVMDANPSYVFFREMTDLRPDDGPVGALGLSLTPGRSAAVDPHFIPLGAPLWIDTRDPVAGRKLQQLMLAQDVGGAIRGPARADLFFGWGEDAERRAGGMLGRGAEYVLLPRQDELMMAQADQPRVQQVALLAAR